MAKIHAIEGNTGGDVRSPAKNFIGNYSIRIDETWYSLRKSILKAVG